MPTLCVECTKPIAAGTVTARGPRGEMHYSCFKMGRAHYQEVAVERCDECGSKKPQGGTCPNCGFGSKSN